MPQVASKTSVRPTGAPDPRFAMPLDDLEAGPSSPREGSTIGPSEDADVNEPGDEGAEDSTDVVEGSEHDEEDIDDTLDGMDPSGFAGPTDKIVKPLTPEALTAFKAAQDKAGVIYISRIPPGMRPTKVRHILGQHGAIGRVYLQQEDAKRAYLRRKHTSTKKAHFTEGWVEFKDKKIARAVADLLNAQPIGGKKGTRWRDDIWTMKYLPKFKWNMLTEQIAHEAAIHRARLGVELSQSRTEQREYLKNVELARVLDKRAERKRQADGKADKDGSLVAPQLLREPLNGKRRPDDGDRDQVLSKKPRKERPDPFDDAKSRKDLGSVLGSIF